MRLRNFLVIMGVWVALLPHIGFSIATENVLFSITGFLLIVVSFYVAAIEDKHQHKRIIKDGNIKESAQQTLSKLKTIRKKSSEKTKGSSIKKEVIPEQSPDSVRVNEDEDTGPRIKKAQSDVKINMDSLDDIIS